MDKDAQNRSGTWYVLIAVALLVLLLALYGCTQQQRQAGGVLLSADPTTAAALTYRNALAKVEAVNVLLAARWDDLGPEDQEVVTGTAETVRSIQGEADTLLARGTLPTAAELVPLLDAGMDAYIEVSSMTVRNAGLWTPEEHETFGAAQEHLKTLERNVRALIAAGKMREAGVALGKVLRVAAAIAL